MSDFFKLSQHEHYLGAKNTLFISEEEFPQMLEKALGENSQIIANFLETEPKNELFTAGASLKYSGKNASLISIIMKLESRNTFCSLFPCFDIGLEYKGKLECVQVWDNGCEAQIELSTDAYTMIFYDENFIANRDFYETSDVRARIYAIAFNANLVEDEIVKIKASEAHIKAGFAKKVGDELSFHTGQMSAWLPCFDDENRDIDEVEIRGEVLGIKELDLELFNKSAFVLTLKVFVNSDDEKNIEVIFTNDSWGEEKPPKIGDFISVYAGLCGEIIR